MNEGTDRSVERAVERGTQGGLQRPGAEPAAQEAAAAARRDQHAHPAGDGDARRPHEDEGRLRAEPRPRRSALHRGPAHRERRQVRSFFSRFSLSFFFALSR